MFKLMLLNVEAGAAAGYLLVVFYSSQLLGSLNLSLDLTLPPNRHAFSVYAVGFRREACAFKLIRLTGGRFGCCVHTNAGYWVFTQTL